MLIITEATINAFASFLTRQERRRENGSRTSNLYIIHAEPRAPL